MPRYHVTTFGCQMNEHDSERMKGMLEAIGYDEVEDREQADLILFNTCSIREAADTRFVAHLAHGEAHQARAQGRRDRRRRVLGAVGQGRGLRAVPVRRRRVRSRPGAPARRVPDVGLADRAGVLRVRGLHRRPADAARPRASGLGADQRGLQLPLQLLHRPEHPRAGGQPAVRRPRRRGGAPRRRRCARGDAARAERQLLRARPAARRAARSASCCARSTRFPGSSACATRARIPRTCART